MPDLENSSSVEAGIGNLGGPTRALSFACLRSYLQPFRNGYIAAINAFESVNFTRQSLFTRPEYRS